MNKGQLIEFFRHRFPDNVVDAFEKVPREKFVPENLRSLAYEDIAIPINENETISQPSTIAVMLSLLKLRDEHKVLEIGSGCGYVLALISEIIKDRGFVYGVEIASELYELCRDNIENIQNAEIYNMNGKNGLPDKAPFNRILISAALEEVPREILNQLKENGIVVAPIGPRQMQTLTSIKRIGNDFVIVKEIPGFVFVPFIE